MKTGQDQGYFPKPSKSLLVLYTPGQEEVTRREFVTEGLVLNFFSGSRYLGGLSSPARRFGGVSETPSGGMGPRGNILR